MGDVVSILHSLSCKECAKHLCGNASMHSQCCDDQDMCNCDLETREIHEHGEEIEVVLDNGCDGWCCNCLLKAHK